MNEKNVRMINTSTIKFRLHLESIYVYYIWHEYCFENAMLLNKMFLFIEWHKIIWMKQQQQYYIIHCCTLYTVHLKLQNLTPISKVSQFNMKEKKRIKKS